MATLLLLLKFSFFPHGALGTPTSFPQNLTALRTNIAPSWVPDPNNRGTWTLLYSCIFTLALCVWTAIHLNVPAHGESSMDQWLRKAKWVMLAIIAPELGLYTSWYQFQQARDFVSELSKVRSDPDLQYQQDSSRTRHEPEQGSNNVSMVNLS